MSNTLSSNYLTSTLQDSTIWLFSIALSLSLHFALFLHSHKQLVSAPATVVQETITHVRFSTLAPPPVKIIESVVKAPKPEPVVPPEPVVQPKAKPKLKPKPKKKKKLKPVVKPRVKKAAKPRPPKKVVKPVKQKQTLSQNISSQKKQFKQSPVVAKADPSLAQQARIKYHALLMRHIEVHKQYPRIARKRKIEGNILVSFTLMANGSIKNLHINGKKSILKKATRQAVEDALPMPEPPGNLSLPMKIEFTMNYFLK
ncbi:MAG: energy transducer TonB [Gammaproteobacteria bacterium]|nr:energy transducer TonB [Gammaproteobacteria bacterium]